MTMPYMYHLSVSLGFLELHPRDELDDVLETL
jgi:hypothetical protein